MRDMISTGFITGAIPVGFFLFTVLLVGVAIFITLRLTRNSHIAMEQRRITARKVFALIGLWSVAGIAMITTFLCVGMSVFLWLAAFDLLYHGP